MAAGEPMAHQLRIMAAEAGFGGSIHLVLLIVAGQAVIQAVAAIFQVVEVVQAVVIVAADQFQEEADSEVLEQALVHNVLKNRFRESLQRFS